MIMALVMKRKWDSGDDNINVRYQDHMKHW